MSDLDKLIIRTWSAIVARGLDGNPWQVAAEAGLAPDDVAKRMAALRACDQLPWPEAVVS